MKATFAIEPSPDVIGYSFICVPSNIRTLFFVKAASPTLVIRVLRISLRDVII